MAVEVRYLVDNVSVDNPEQMITLFDNFDASASRVCGSTVLALGVEVSDGIDPLAAIRTETLRLEEMVQLRACDVDLDLVDEGEIADRLNKSRQLINLYAKGERGQDFPPPYALPGGRRVWTWASIARWVRLYKQAWDSDDEPDHLSREQQQELAAWLTQRSKVLAASARFDILLSNKFLACTVPGGAYIKHMPLGTESKWNIEQPKTPVA